MSFWLDALGAEVRYYDAQGVRTRVIESGDGEPLVLMHGLTGHAESFIKNIVPLAERGFHVYAIDLIGHGFTDKPPNLTYATAAFTDHLGTFLDAVGLESAHCAGQSLGSWVAWRFAVEHPARVRSLISLTGAGFLLADQASKEESEDIHNKVRSVTKRALDEPTRERVRERLEWLMLDPETVTDELVDVRYRIFIQPESRAVMGKVNEDFTGPDNRMSMLTEDVLATIQHPALIVWTDHNPSTPAAVGERVAEVMPNARYALVEGAGHWPQFEQADIVNGLVADFLTELEEGDAPAPAVAR